MPNLDPQWLTLAQTLLTFFGGGLAGWFTHRRRERVTREEETRAALVKLQMDSLAEVLRNLASAHVMKRRVISDLEFASRGMSPPLPLEEGDVVKMATYVQVSASLAFLVPIDTRASIQAFIAAIDKATSDEELGAASVALANSMSPYFPSPLRRRKWFGLLG